MRFLLLALLVLASAPTAAGAPPPLPSGRAWTSAFFDGSSTFVLGGCADDLCPTSEILEFSPARGAWAAREERLPSGRVGAAAVWTGKAAYLFGGGTRADPLDEVVRFVPSAREVRVLEARLPTGLSKVAAAWTGREVVLLGGTTGSYEASDRIFVFDPANETLREAGARLPTPRAGAAAAYADGRVLLFGGGYGDAPTRQILTYDVARDEAVVVQATLPRGRADASAAWTGSEVVLFGGTGPDNAEDSAPSTLDVVRFDPTSRAVTLEALAHPGQPSGFAAVWTGAGALLVGGQGCSRDGWGGCASVVPWPAASVVEEPGTPPARAAPTPAPGSTAALAAFVAVALATRRIDRSGKSSNDSRTP